MRARAVRTAGAAALAAACMAAWPGAASADPPSVSLTPAEVDFGSQRVGTTGVQIAVFKNEGPGAIEFARVAIGLGEDEFGLGFSLGPNCTVGLPLAPGESCEIAVTFTPGSSGSKVGTLLASATNADGQQTAQSYLLGTGATASFALDRAGPYDFGTRQIGSPSPPLVIQAQNVSTVPITMGPTAFNSGVGYSVTSDLCAGTTLTPPDSDATGGPDTCTVSVVFNPPVAAFLNDAVVFQESGTGFTSQLQIVGTGVPPPGTGSLTPGSADLGSIPPGGTVARDFVFANTGSGPVAVSGASITGSPGFAIQSDGCSGHTLPSANPDATCTVTVRFSSADLGTHSAALSVLSDAAGPADISSLSGTVAQPAAAPVPPPPTCKKGQKLKGDRCVKKKRKKRRA